MDMLTFKEIMAEIEGNLQSIHKYGVERIGVFGSYVKEGATPQSDIDILVEFRKGEKSFDNYMDLKFFLEDLLGSKIDLVIKENIKPDLKHHILGEVKYAL